MKQPSPPTIWLKSCSGSGVMKRTADSVSCPPGFSLIELLLVVGVIAVLSVATIPSLASVDRANRITRAGYDIAGVLEQARTHAMAYNTYTWVGFSPGQDKSLTMGVIASKNGGNPSTNASGELAPTDIVALGRLRTFNHIELGELTATNRPAPQSQLAARGQAIRSFKIKASGEEATFNKYVIEFNNRGEARVATGAISRLVEIGLTQPQSAEDYLAIQVAGLSGNVAVYRP